MEVLVALGLVCWVGYGLFKGNTKRGVETVRAHIFLLGLAAGDSIKQADWISDADVVDGPTEVIRDAMDHVKTGYGGKQTVMISDAYSKGMKPRLPFWYRTILLRASTPPSTVS